MTGSDAEDVPAAPPVIPDDGKTGVVVAGGGDGKANIESDGKSNIASTEIDTSGNGSSSDVPGVGGIADSVGAANHGVGSITDSVGAVESIGAADGAAESTGNADPTDDGHAAASNKFERLPVADSLLGIPYARVKAWLLKEVDDRFDVAPNTDTMVDYILNHFNATEVDTFASFKAIADTGLTQALKGFMEDETEDFISVFSKWVRANKTVGRIPALELDGSDDENIEEAFARTSLEDKTERNATKNKSEEAETETIVIDDDEDNPSDTKAVAPEIPARDPNLEQKEADKDDGELMEEESVTVDLQQPRGSRRDSKKHRHPDPKPRVSFGSPSSRQGPRRWRDRSRGPTASRRGRRDRSRNDRFRTRGGFRSLSPGRRASSPGQLVPASEPNADDDEDDEFSVEPRRRVLRDQLKSKEDHLRRRIKKMQQQLDALQSLGKQIEHNDGLVYFLYDEKIAKNGGRSLRITDTPRRNERKHESNVGLPCVKSMGEIAGDWQMKYENGFRVNYTISRHGEIRLPKWPPSQSMQGRERVYGVTIHGWDGTARVTSDDNHFFFHPIGYSPRQRKNGDTECWEWIRVSGGILESVFFKGTQRVTRGIGRRIQNKVARNSLTN